VSDESNSWTKTTCAYCGVGCGVEGRVRGDGLLEVRGDKDHPANYGRLCSKGLALGETVVSNGRLTKPIINRKEKDWDYALDYVAQRLKETIEEFGPDAVGFYVSGQLLTEDYYVANKLMKGFIGSANIDTNSRLCMSSSVAGHIRAFGSDTVPGCYEDIELADMVVLVGSNLAWCHPVIYQRLKNAKQKRPHMKVVVVDPRRTDTCDIADLHLAIKPGTDVALFNGLLAYLVKHEHLDKSFIEAHTEGLLDALPIALQESADSEALAKHLGVGVADLMDFFQWFALTANTVTVFSQGVNQSSQGTDKVNSIINCHLATGRIGKPGCGPFSITGQPNAMGGREVGGLANTLAAHMDFSEPENVERVRTFWQASSMAHEPGLKAVDMFNAVADGRIKFLWIMATNPLVSMPNTNKLRRALDACPTVVISDCVADTDTTRHAKVLLPATGWSEKSGTVTNSERRISRQRGVLAPHGEARPDWWIICEVAKRLGFAAAFNYASEHEIFTEYARLTGLDNHGSRDLDISALATLSKDEYDALSPQQWPLPKNAPQQTAQTNKRLFADGQFFTPSGRARFVATASRAPVEVTSREYPFILNTGRIRDQWHTMTRTGLTHRLTGHLPEPFVAVHVKDAQAHGLVDKGLATVRSSRGAARVRVQVSADVQRGHLFMPIHWTHVHSSDAVIGNLTAPHVDPVSGQPELKHTAVTVEPYITNSEARLICRNKAGLVLSQMDCGYWAEQAIPGGYSYSVACTVTPKALQEKLQALRPEGVEFELLDFSNPGKGEYRSAVGNSEQWLFACVVGSRLSDLDLEWLTRLLDEKMYSTGRRAIAKGAAVGTLASGRIVCACHQVGRNSICQAIRSENLSTASEVGRATKAGTGCGSCVPEINRILDEEITVLEAV
jgi:assimilatory nitrate reductase catalytic subunit